MGVGIRTCREEAVKTQARDQPLHLQIHGNHKSLRWSILLWEKKKGTDTENKQFLQLNWGSPNQLSCFFLFS